MGTKGGSPVPQSPASSASVKIAATQVMPGASPALSVGDLLQLTVRTNPKDGGLGLVYLRGQLIQAALPENVVTGDKITARLEKQGNQVLFRILEINPADKTKIAAPGVSLSDKAPLSSPAEELLVEVFEKLVSTLSASLPQDEQQIILPEALGRPAGRGAAGQSEPQVQAVFAELSKTLLAISEHQDGQAVANAIKAVTSGSVATSLRQLAEIIRASIPLDIAAGAPVDRLFDALREELQLLLDKPPVQAALIQKVMERLLTSLQDELRPGRTSISPAGKEVLAKIQSQLLHVARAPEELEQHVQQALGFLDAAGATAQRKAANDIAKGNAELHLLANRLDGLAATYDSINQLNSVLQAMGEPAMILFPYLLQGMICHTELVIDPDANRGSKRKKKDADGEDENAETQQFTKVHVTVPLPSLGLISVEVAHRESEVLTRIRVESSEVAAFIQEHIEDLAQALRGANLTLTDFTTAVGIDESQLLERRVVSDTHTSFVA